MSGRLKSTDPEPVPARELGYYWVRIAGLAPFVAEYTYVTCRDQLLGDDGTLSERQILSEYGWDCPGTNEFVGDDDGLEVLSERLTLPPSTVCGFETVVWRPSGGPPEPSGTVTLRCQLAAGHGGEHGIGWKETGRT